MKNKFSWRAFISIGLLYTFIIIFLTGIVLYLSPAGRIAHWVNWKLLGFSKEQWQAIHTVFSYLFVILSIFHLFTVNWKAFWSYLKSKSKQGINKKREFWFSSIFTIVIFFIVIFSLPPFSYVMDLGTYLTDSWETEMNEPPIPHAELLTLNELSEQMGISETDSLLNILRKNDIVFNSAEETLTDIGIANDMSPNAIYNIIQETRNLKMTGTGIGRKTLEEFASENDKDISELIQLLNKSNIRAKSDQTIKDIAEENDMAAKDVYDLIK